MSAAARLSQQFREGALDLEQYYEELLARCRVENEKLNCFISITDRLVEASISRLKNKLSSGKALGRLFGIPIVVKDNICVRGYPTTCGSRILALYDSPFNATVVEKLLEQDAVIIAKSNLDEFGMGSSNENSAFGAARNPHDPLCVPGGSSGGSAAAVAAGLAPIALGSDTGGSIRQPAAYCGVVGLKPTYGTVSRYGLVAYASSLDQIGPITADVDSAALLYEVIVGQDPRDSTSVAHPSPLVRNDLAKSVAGIRIGLPRECFGDGLDPQIDRAVNRAVSLLEEQGIMRQSVSLPNMKYAIAVYYVIADAEASSNLARYDGVRYGLRAKGATDLHEMYSESRREGFGAEVKRRIMLGTYVLSAGYYDAYYQQAQKVRAALARDYEKALKDVDILLTPTTPTTAFKLGEKVDNPLAMYLSDVYTVSINLAGLPAISVPCGYDQSDLPIALQLIGRRYEEGKLLRVAAAVERMMA